MRLLQHLPSFVDACGSVSILCVVFPAQELPNPLFLLSGQPGTNRCPEGPGESSVIHRIPDLAELDRHGIGIGDGGVDGPVPSTRTPGRSSMGPA